MKGEKRKANFLNFKQWDGTVGKKILSIVCEDENFRSGEQDNLMPKSTLCDSGFASYIKLVFWMGEEKRLKSERW